MRDQEPGVREIIFKRGRKMCNIEIFHLTAREAAEMDEEMVYEYMHKYEFRLAATNNNVREAMFDAMIKNEGIESGWFWGTYNDSPVGPLAAMTRRVRTWTYHGMVPNE